HRLPVIHVVRTAATAGYDGLAAMLDAILQDVSRPASRGPLAALRVVPEADRPAIVAWTQRHRGVRDATRAALWRRCQLCASTQEDALTMQHVAGDWEAEAAMAASILARRPFSCACGGPAGDTTRFLMLRHDEDEGERLCEIRASNASSRVACWRLVGEDVEPYDATTFRAEGPGMG